MKAIIRMSLNNMPFDKFDSDVNSFIHATGDSCLLSNGEWVTEFEDCLYENAPLCLHISEEEWDEMENDEWYATVEPIMLSNNMSVNQLLGK